MQYFTLYFNLLYLATLLVKPCSSACSTPGAGHKLEGPAYLTGHRQGKGTWPSWWNHLSFLKTLTLGPARSLPLSLLGGPPCSALLYQGHSLRKVTRTKPAPQQSLWPEAEHVPS